MAKRTEEQGQLIDTDHPGHAKLKRLAKTYVAKREEWTEAHVPVTKAKDALIAEMHEQRLENFKIADLCIKLTPGQDKLKVTLASDDEEDDDPGDND